MDFLTRDELIEKATKDIRTALDDYERHMYDAGPLYDVTDSFIDELAYSAVLAKTELREMFRKSPAWNEDLQALVINGNRTHDPDWERVNDLATLLFEPVFSRSYDDGEEGLLLRCDIRTALLFFGKNGENIEEAIAALNKLAPKAYAKGKKKSRVLKALCDALGVTDNTVGSNFQRTFAEVADEMNGKQISYKLFVSINPAHILTMSNPHSDRRGPCLTSCHSLDATGYTYNAGCCGYARDSVSFIAFTVNDPNDRETLNNRKTTRQMFFYKPGNGLLLQSRMYNTSGGTRGAQAESAIYRDLIQREISECEGAANLWKTYKYYDCSYADAFSTDSDFGGYPDWHYSEFDPHISVRSDHAEDYDDVVIGTSGLCIKCGDETTEGLYCDDCRESGYICDCCEEIFHDEDELWWVHDRRHGDIRVCESCRDDHYCYCEDCGEWFDEDTGYTVDDIYYCESCFENRVGNGEIVRCAECGEYHHADDMNYVFDENGEEVLVCEWCWGHECGTCTVCGETFLSSVELSEDGLCPACFRELETLNSENENDDVVGAAIGAVAEEEVA